MSEDKQLPPSNTRRFGQESDRKYLYLVIFTLVVVGGILIALIYGPESLLTALPCLLGGAVLILLPWAVLTLIQKWRDGIEEGARREAEAIDAAGKDKANR
jgi:protein-S-isoprenylcysteine O-methyltransferase Ste14